MKSWIKSSNMKTTIIIPTYNEKANLAKLVKAIFSLEIKNLNIIIVDDNSPDGTGKLADQLTFNYPLAVIHRPAKLGLGTAYVVGFKQAINQGAAIVIEMDADFSHNPKDLPLLILEINNGYDVAIGSRRIKGGSVKGWNWWRNLESKWAMNFARFILNLRTQDITAGFRAYNTKVFDKINLDKITSNGYAWQEEMIYLCEKYNFKIKEIPIEFIDRQFGQSKLGLREIIEFFITIFRLKFKH